VTGGDAKKVYVEYLLEVCLSLSTCAFMRIVIKLLGVVRLPWRTHNSAPESERDHNRIQSDPALKEDPQQKCVVEQYFYFKRGTVL